MTSRTLHYIRCVSYMCRYDTIGASSLSPRRRTNPDRTTRGPRRALGGGAPRVAREADIWRNGNTTHDVVMGARVERETARDLLGARDLRGRNGRRPRRGACVDGRRMRGGAAAAFSSLPLGASRRSERSLLFSSERGSAAHACAVAAVARGWGWHHRSFRGDRQEKTSRSTTTPTIPARVYVLCPRRFSLDNNFDDDDSRV